jgi:hypothetical protein
VGTEKHVLSEELLAKLNAAHYKALLAQANMAIAERNLLDAQRIYQEENSKRTETIAAIGKKLGRGIKTWSTETGDVEYVPVPSKPEPPATAVSDPEHGSESAPDTE